MHSGKNITKQISPNTLVSGFKVNMRQSSPDSTQIDKDKKCKIAKKVGAERPYSASLPQLQNYGVSYCFLFK